MVGEQRLLGTPTFCRCGSGKTLEIPGIPGTGVTAAQTDTGSLTTSSFLVPSKGLEPPHRCRYMDLNHARLPIPPRWQVDFNRRSGPHGLPDQEGLLFYSTGARLAVKPVPPRHPGNKA